MRRGSGSNAQTAERYLAHVRSVHDLLAFLHLPLGQRRAACDLLQAPPKSQPIHAPHVVWSCSPALAHLKLQVGHAELDVLRQQLDLGLCIARVRERSPRRAAPERAAAVARRRRSQRADQTHVYQPTENSLYYFPLSVMPICITLERGSTEPCLSTQNIPIL